MENIIKKIEEKNSYNFNYMNFSELLKTRKRDIYKRIISKHIIKKYSRFFLDNQKKEIDKIKFDKYLENIFKYIEKNILGKKINTKLLEEFYFEIYSFKNISIKKDVLRNEINNVNMQAKEKNEKKYLDYSHYKDVLEKLNISINEFNNTKNRKKYLEKLYDLIIDNFLLKIHPFVDNNFAFSSILLDILLLEKLFLPLGLKDIVKENNIKIHSLEDFLILQFNIYNNYKY